MSGKRLFLMAGVVLCSCAVMGVGCGQRVKSLTEVEPKSASSTEVMVIRGVPPPSTATASPTAR